MSKYKVCFQNALKYLLKRDSISQRYLGWLLCVSKQTVSRWCNGVTYPDFDKLCDLCFIFCVTPDFFFLFVQS